MKIALVAPPAVRVPPEKYGGTERVVHVLGQELKRRGHKVKLFAAGGSLSPGELEAVCPKPLWDMPGADHFAYRVLQVRKVMQQSREFDLIHSHVEWIPWLTQLEAPLVTTLHGYMGALGRPELAAAFPEQALISISNSQRKPLEHLSLNWVDTVYHGDDYGRIYHYGPGDGGYLAFIGRFSPQKGPQTAIKVALRAGVGIILAARLDSVDKAFFAKEVEPYLDHPLVKWVGELDDRGKAQLLAGAMGLILPIDWDEPFGLVFPEALAAGTPVITRPRGSVPEIIQHGVHGYAVEAEDDMVDAVFRLHEIDRRACRRYALRTFSVKRMVDGYEAAYRAVIGRTTPALVAAE